MGQIYRQPNSTFSRKKLETDAPITKEHWHDVTVTPLPNAPSTKIYCLYGVGAETQVGYYYITGWGDYERDEDKCVAMTSAILPFF